MARFRSARSLAVLALLAMSLLAVGSPQSQKQRKKRIPRANTVRPSSGSAAAAVSGAAQAPTSAGHLGGGPAASLLARPLHIDSWPEPRCQGEATLPRFVVPGEGDMAEQVRSDQIREIITS
jgi:hypothetical protein